MPLASCAPLLLDPQSDLVSFSSSSLVLAIWQRSRLLLLASLSSLWLLIVLVLPLSHLVSSLLLSHLSSHVSPCLPSVSAVKSCCLLVLSLGLSLSQSWNCSGSWRLSESRLRIKTLVVELTRVLKGSRFIRHPAAVSLSLQSSLTSCRCSSQGFGRPWACAPPLPGVLAWLPARRARGRAGTSPGLRGSQAHTYGPPTHPSHAPLGTLGAHCIRCR